MLRKIFCFLVVLLLPCMFFCVPYSYCAGDGKALFQSRCGKCHTQGGEAPVFSPIKYASNQWQRFFSKDKHKRKKDISGEISADDLNAIKQFLIDHAADSDLPIAAGTR